MPFELPQSVMAMLQGGGPMTGMPAPAPMPEVAPPANFGLPPSVTDFLGVTQPGAATAPAPPTVEPVAPIPPREPVQATPDYNAGTVDPKRGLANIVPPNVTAASQPAGPPTLAGATAQQNAATQTALDANRNMTAVASDRAGAVSNVMDEGQARLDQIAADQKEFQERSEQIRNDKHAAVNAANAQVDNYKVDQQKYWHDASTAKKVGWLVSMAVSGLGQALQGKSGPNPVAEMLSQAAARSVASQMDTRNQLKESAARKTGEVDAWDRFSSNKDAQYHAGLSQAQTLLAQQVNTTAAKYGSPEAIANGQKVAAELLKGAGENAQKAAEFAANHDIAKGNLAVSRGQLGVSVAAQKENVRHNMAMEDLTSQQRDIAAAAALEAGKSDEAKLIRERSMGGEVIPVKDAEGNVVDYKTGLITNKDGTVWIPNGTEAKVTELQKQHEAAVQLVQTLDAIRREGPEWLSDTANSDKKQRLDQLFKDATLQAIAAKGLGVPTGNDIELAQGVIGTTDPTRYKDSIAGLNQARESLVRNHNVVLKRAGLDKDWNPVDTGKKGAAAQPGDDAQKLISTDPRKLSSDQWRNETGSSPTDYSGPNGQNRARDVFAKTGNMLPSQRTALDNWGAMLASKDLGQRRTAATYLQNAIDKGGNSAIREYAQQLLNQQLNPAEIFAGATPERVR